MLHNFENSLRCERAKAAFADDFYRDYLPVSDIVRYDADTEYDMDWQRRDVDLTLTLLDGTTCHVSEKFREENFGDLYIEVFSKYPDKPGWMHTGSPDVLAYFMPDAVYLIEHKSLKTFCLQTLFPAIPSQWYAELYASEKLVVEKRFVSGNDNVKVFLIQAHNRATDGTRWETIGVAVPFTLLKKNHVVFNVYSLKC